MSLCRVPRCGRRSIARRLCSRHYQLLKKSGQLRPISEQQAFRMKCVITPSGCVEWTGAVSSGGYGNFRGRCAHRVAYEAQYGPVDAALQLDHLCRNTLCVNPDHLEPVTPWVNTMRSRSPSAINAGRLVCTAGHRLDAANTYRRPDGRRECRACHRRQELERYHRMKERPA